MFVKTANVTANFSGLIADLHQLEITINMGRASSLYIERIERLMLDANDVVGEALRIAEAEEAAALVAAQSDSESIETTTMQKQTMQ
ncbi:hypothetical protein HAP47_0001495 [Bradyrhizobium sp. 41S5]|uniref:hypothetical protein n=1 Tax=Bradyrhizobium sp. 41S5 TaxID=1404443 RepID=UPI00156B57BD|nr:hypothetical protein [Bradyrhizobium sp. 41S5]UFX45434.1 hypothetical protein HAP47_0001495 [Bradyrhizobium sp. 41S5]